LSVLGGRGLLSGELDKLTYTLANHTITRLANAHLPPVIVGVKPTRLTLSLAFAPPYPTVL